MNKITKDLLDISAILAIILAIVSFFVPILLWWFFIVGLVVLLWVFGIFWEKRTLWIVAIILAIVSLLVSPTFWLIIIGNKAYNKQVATENQFKIQSSQNEVGDITKKEELKVNTFTNEKECPENYDNNSIEIPDNVKTINDAMNLIAMKNTPKFEDFCSISNAWSPYMSIDGEDEFGFKGFSDGQYTISLTMTEKKKKSIGSYINYLIRAYKELLQAFPNASQAEIGYAKRVLDANIYAVWFQIDALRGLESRNSMYIKYKNDLNKKQWRVYTDFQLYITQYYDAFKTQSSKWISVRYYNWNN